MEDQNSKMDEKRDASTLALLEILKGFMTQKEAREERKCQEKEEQIKAFFDIQNKKLEIKQSIARTKANEVKLTRISKEMKIMMVGLSKVSQRKMVRFKKQDEIVTSNPVWFFLWIGYPP